MTLLERYRAEEPRPNASCLLYLFADALLPEQRLGDRLLHRVAVPTPGTGTPVSLRSLEDHLLAVAVYDLWTGGVIDCEFDGEAHGPSWLWITPGTEEAPTDLGVEGHLLDLLPEESISLGEVVEDRWPPEGWAYLPLNGLVIDAQLEAATRGITGPPATPEFTAAGYYRFPPVDADGRRLARLKAELDPADVGWLDALVDGSLRSLVTHCHRVIDAARPSRPLGDGSPG